MSPLWLFFSWLLMHNKPLHKLVTKTLIVCRGHSSAGWQFGLNSSGESFVLPGLPEVSEVAWLCFGYRDGCSPLFPQKLGLSRDCSRCLREHRSKQNLPASHCVVFLTKSSLWTSLFQQQACRDIPPAPAWQSNPRPSLHILGKCLPLTYIPADAPPYMTC